ncbi:MAG TPA: hypothetical protein PLJ47_16835 [Candidatus Hydrogenedentes bacterium]|nr:hypothetical protein [Candidatus Hydrogenedentota bacterium]
MAGCPICGFDLRAGAAQCPACQADLAQAAALSADFLGPAPVRAASPPAAPAKRLRSRQEYGKASLSGLIWGAILAVPMGLLGLGTLWAVFQNEITNAILFSGFEFGALVGFMIGSIWGFSNTLELSPGVAALYGLVIGGSLMLINHFAEWLFIAEPDHAAYQYALMGCAAGAVAGWACMMLREFRQN